MHLSRSHVRFAFANHKKPCSQSITLVERVFRASVLDLEQRNVTVWRLELSSRTLCSDACHAIIDSREALCARLLIIADCEMLITCNTRRLVPTHKSSRSRPAHVISSLFALTHVSIIITKRLLTSARRSPSDTVTTNRSVSEHASRLCGLRTNDS